MSLLISLQKTLNSQDSWGFSSSMLRRKWGQQDRIYFLLYHNVLCCAKSLHSCSTLCNPMDWLLPIKFFYPWDSPGKNTGVGCHFLLEGSSQSRTEFGSPALQTDALPSELITLTLKKIDLYIFSCNKTYNHRNAWCFKPGIILNHNNSPNIFFIY